MLMRRGRKKSVKMRRIKRRRNQVIKCLSEKSWDKASVSHYSSLPFIHTHTHTHTHPHTHTHTHPHTHTIFRGSSYDDEGSPRVCAPRMCVWGRESERERVCVCVCVKVAHVCVGGHQLNSNDHQFLGQSFQINFVKFFYKTKSCFFAQLLYWISKSS